MFILSIVPLHLSLDSNSTPVNNLDEADVSEHRVMQLEALLTSLITRQYLGVYVEGVDNTDINAVARELESERTHELELIGSSNTTVDNDSDATARLSELTRANGWVNQRVTDLQSLLSALDQGTTLSYHVSGVINTDKNMVTAELSKALAYKEVLATTNQFWNQVLGSETLNQQTQNQASTATGSSTGTTTDTSNTGSSTGTTTDTSNTGSSTGTTTDTSNTGSSTGTTTGTSNTGNSTGTNNTGTSTNNSITIGIGSTGVASTSNSSYNYLDDPEIVSFLAISKRRALDLGILLSSIIIEEPVEVLVSEETEIKQELQNELNKATTFLSNDTGNANSSARKILELRGKLQTIAGQKSIAELSSQVQASVASTLKNEVNQINSY